MTIIEAGWASPATFSSTPSEPTKALPHGYNSDTACWLAGGKILITADSPEALQAFLARLSLQCEKPIADLDANDVYGHCSNNGIRTQTRTIDGETFSEIHIGSDEELETHRFNNDEYFMDELPTFPPGSGLYLSSRFDTDSTGPARDLGLAGLMGTAQTLYSSNYGSGSPPSSIESGLLDPNTRQLLTDLFGPKVTFNQGHLNVLKMMGLVNGKATDSTLNWLLNADGLALLGSFDKGPVPFIPSMGLLQLPIDLKVMSGGVSRFFSPNGFVSGFSCGSVESAAQTIAAGMPADGSTLPANLTIPGESVGKLLNYVFGMAQGNTQFTTAQVNTAIAMGLIQYDPANNSLSISTNGQTYLRTKETPPAPEPTPDPTANWTGEQKIARGFEYLTTGWYDVFDVGSGNQGDDDYRISKEDIDHLASLEGPDDPRWDDENAPHAWRNVPYEQRQQIINLARYLKRVIEENPDAWNKLAQWDNLFDEDEMKVYVASFNPEHIRAPI